MFTRLAFTQVVAVLVVLTTTLSYTANADAARTVVANGLQIEITSGYNLVIDNNVETPATFAPQAAYMQARVTNVSGGPLTNVFAYIGNNTLNTPGVYPALGPDPNVGGTDYIGTFALIHEGGTSDATRYLGTLANNESVEVYWLVTYPVLDDNNQSLSGGNSPVDDMPFDFDVWSSSSLGAGPVVEATVTVRKMLSAAANKIEPNNANKVPQIYQDQLAEFAPAWTDDPENGSPGTTITSQGVWYDLGNVGEGFDNNGNLVPDRNVWLQPIGNPSANFASSFRLVETRALLFIKTNTGIVPITGEDQLYFPEQIPADNSGGFGYVEYRYVSLAAGVTFRLTPYQAIASGSGSEKFNGDFGAGGGDDEIVTPGPAMDFTKTATPDSGTTVDPLTNEGITYLLTATNTGSEYDIGNPDFLMPLVFSDSIPTGTTYVAGSAVANNGVTGNATGTFTVFYSIDNGATWTAAEPGTPGDVTDLQWWLSAPLAKDDGTGADETAFVEFEVTVDNPVPANTTAIFNTGGVGVGNGAPALTATTQTGVAGTRTITASVFEDSGAGNNYGNGAQDGGEASINGVTVTLYLDANNNGILEPDELANPFADAETSGGSGVTFSFLPDGNFFVVVDDGDPQIPNGSSPTTDVLIPVSTAGANAAVAFGFATALQVVKTQDVANPILEGQTVSYSITMNNRYVGFGSGVTITDIYTSDADDASPGSNPVSKQWDSDTNTAPAEQDFAEGAPTTSLSSPDGLSTADSANTGFASADDELYGYGYLLVDPADGSGVDSVQAIIYGDFDANAAGAGASVTISYFNGATETPLITYSNTPGTPAGSVAYPSDGLWQIPVPEAAAPGGTWDYADFNASIQIRMLSDNSSNPKTARLYIDAFGLRVTTSTPPTGGGNATNTLATVPITDTYDPTKLEFVSASVNPTSHNPATGVLVWDKANVGPIFPGGSETLTVTFRVLDDSDTGGVTSDTVNSATSSGALFEDGSTANTSTSAPDVQIDPAGTISGNVFFDPDADGLGGTNPALAGVDVQITIPGGATLTTTTDANGYYEFTGLTVTGDYAVTVLQGTLPGGSGTVSYDTDDGTTAPDGIVNTVGFDPTDDDPDDDLEANFGFTGIDSRISGYLWHDYNRSGTPSADTNEPNFESVTVTLDDGSSTTTTTTDANGYFEFDVSATGPYTLTVSTNTGDMNGPTWIASYDSDGTGTANVAVNITTLGETAFADFSYYAFGTFTIGDTLYYDWNANSTQQTAPTPQEEGIANVDVSLYWDSDAAGPANGIVDANDVLIETVSTGVNGVYVFANTYAADNYVVAVNTNDPDFPTSYVATQDPDNVGVTGDAQAGITLVASNPNVDFGFDPTGGGTVNGTVFGDTDGNGSQSASEDGLEPVTVELWADFNGDGTYVLVFSTTTDTDGNYEFPDLPDGNYEVRVDTTDTDLGVDPFGNVFGATTTTENQLAISGGNTSENNFGFGALGVMGDTIYWDANGNGTPDAGELGIPNVTISLFIDENDNGFYDLGETPAGTTTTDSNGNYYFTGLTTDDYVVVVDLADSDLLGADLTADPDSDGLTCIQAAADAGTPDCDGETAARVGIGNNFVGANFGFQPPGVIGQKVWIDLNQDGIIDGNEPGVANLTINLYLDDGDMVLTGADGAPVATTTTDANGEYSFYNLTDATDYLVEVTAFTTTPPTTLSFDPQGAVDGVALVTVDTAVPNLDVNFGYSYTGTNTLGGTIGLDTVTANGVVDGTEPRLEGYTVVATFWNDANTDGRFWIDSTANGIFDFGEALDVSELTSITSVGTDANGNYLFDDVLPDFGANQGWIISVVPPDSNLDLTTVAADIPASSSIIEHNIGGETVAAYQLITTLADPISGVDFAFVLVGNFDFGDADDSYATSFASNGARHEIISAGSLFLGTAPDFEGDGQASTNADGDDNLGSDDEDGVSFAPTLQWDEGTGGASIQVTVGGTAGGGYLVGWIDFEQADGFLGTGNTVINQSVVNGTASIPINVPAGTFSALATTPLRARFRLFTAPPAVPGFAYDGGAVNGEVEDYLITLGVISGIVWDDLDGDGIRAGEPGINAVTVTIYQDLGTTGDYDDGVDVPLQSFTTANNGSEDGAYNFTGLPAGDYIVRVTDTGLLLTDYLFTNPVSGDKFKAIELGNGNPLFVDTADFGASLDSDGDGVIDTIDVDDDNDGITDVDEGGDTLDSDGDGIPNRLDIDADNDGISDAVEANGGTPPTGYNPATGVIEIGIGGVVDNDGDGLLSSVDSDDNASGTTTTISAPTSSDSDGIADFLDIDSDNDCIVDNVEAQGEGAYVAPAGTDFDNNGRDDAYDAGGAAATLLDSPTNTDSIDTPDYIDADSDNDGVPDAIEGNDVDRDGVSDVAGGDTGDTDGDGLINACDTDNTTPLAIDNPTASNSPLQDTDFDGTRDWRDVDDDNDGIPTASEDTTGGPGPDGDWSNDFAQGGGAIPDYLFNPDNDGDGINNDVDIDDDNDGILDVAEGGGIDPGASADGPDGVPNYRDLDDGVGSDLDVNNDGIDDGFDFDLDGIPDHFDTDSDGDGIDDAIEANSGTPPADYNPATGEVECPGGVGANGLGDCIETSLGPESGISTLPNPDTDGDGYADAQDLDSDNDGIPDSIEGNDDTDGDGVPNYLDIDSDNDGIVDLIEAGGTDADGDGIVDAMADRDNDGIPDSVDADDDGVAGTDAGKDDADMDGIIDAADVDLAGVDTDGDGINDANDPDANGDGYDDATAASPLPIPNSDGDGLYPDYLDIDADNDSIPDNIEAQTTAGYVAPLGTDSDGDGLDDAYDQFDNTGGSAAQTGTAIDPEDTDNDGTPDYLDLDSDNDLLTDLEEANRTGVGTPGADVDMDGLDDGVDDNVGAWNPSDGIAPAADLPDGVTGGDVAYREAMSFESYTIAYVSGNPIDDFFYADPHGVASAEIVFTGGSGFAAGGTYDVAYYDANGDLVFTDTAATADASGDLQSSYANNLTQDAAAGHLDYGQWTAIVLIDGTTPDSDRDTQLADTATSIASDEFTVRSLSAPEFRTAADATATGYDVIAGGGVAYPQVSDADQNTDPLTIETIEVTVTSDTTGDSETFTLYETGPNTGVFADNSVGDRYILNMTSIVAGAANDNSLYVPATQDITISYVDSSDAGDVSSATVPVTVDTSAPLQGTKVGVGTAGSVPITIGARYQFTVTLAFTGDTNNIVLEDTLPAGMVLEDTAPYEIAYSLTDIRRIGTGTPGSADETDFTSRPSAGETGTIEWDIGNVDLNMGAATGTIEISYYVRIDSTVDAGDVLTNEAVLSFASGASSGGPFTIGQVPVTIAEPSIEIVANAENVTPCSSTSTGRLPYHAPEQGDTVRYTVTVTNSGTSTAYDVLIIDTIAAGVDYLASTTSLTSPSTSVSTLAQPTGGPNGPLVWGSGGDIDLDAGETFVFTYDVQVTTSTANDPIDNAVSITTSSLDGSITGERTTGTGYSASEAVIINTFVEPANIEVSGDGAISATGLLSGAITGGQLTGSTELLFTSTATVTVTGDGFPREAAPGTDPTPFGAPSLTVNSNVVATLDAASGMILDRVIINDDSRLVLSGGTAFTFGSLTMGVNSIIELPDGASLSVVGSTTMNGSANFPATILAQEGDNFNVTFVCGYDGDDVLFANQGTGTITFEGPTTIDTATFRGASPGGPFIKFSYDDPAGPSPVTWTDLTFFAAGGKTTIESDVGSETVNVSGYNSSTGTTGGEGSDFDTADDGTFGLVNWGGATPAFGFVGIADAAPGGILVSWRTEIEDAVLKFVVERQVNGAWQNVGERFATGGSFDGASYDLLDGRMPLGIDVSYRVTVVDVDGSQEIFTAGSAVATQQSAPAKSAARSVARSVNVSDLPAASVRTPRYPVAGPASPTPRQTGTARKAPVTATGLYAVNGNDAVYNLGQQLPVLDDALVFVRSLSDFFTPENVVWQGDLAIAGDPGTAPVPAANGVLTADGYRQIVHHEVDSLFWINFGTRAGPNWYFPADKSLNANTSQTFQLLVNEPLAGTATLTIAVNGRSQDAHDLAITVNGNDVAGATWTGGGHRLLTASFDAANLVDGLNEITLATGNNGSAKFLDYVELETPALPSIGSDGLVVRVEADVESWALPNGVSHVVDATTFGGESLIATENGTVNDLTADSLLFLAGSTPTLDWSTAQTLTAVADADYLAVAPAAMLPKLQPLLDAHEARGLTVSAASFEQVRDVYGAGIYGPAGLATLVRELEPEFLLIGSRTNFDYHNRQGRNAPNGVPTGWVHVAEGLAASDDLFTNGYRTAVGRLPATDATELESMVAKILAHRPARRAVMLSGEDYKGNDRDDRFAKWQSQLGQRLPSAVISSTNRPNKNVRDELREALKAGSRIITYQGHGSIRALDEIDGNVLFESSDAEGLPPAAWVISSCLTGSYFVNNLEQEVLGQRLMAMPGAGGVSVICSTRYGQMHEENIILETILGELQDGDGRWGHLMLAAKKALRGSPTAQVYTLFGDPALPAIDSADNRRIRLLSPLAGDVIGGEGPIQVKFRLTSSDWWRETLRVQYRQNGGDPVTIQELELTPGVATYTIEWTPPADSNDYEIEIEEITQ